MFADDANETILGEGQEDSLVYDLESTPDAKPMEAMPPGWYEADIEEIEFKESSNGNPMLAIKYTVAEGDYKGRKLFENYVLNNEIGLSRLKVFLRAAVPNMDLKAFKPQQFADSGEGCGERVSVRAVVKRYDGRKINNVKEVRASKGSADDLFGG